MVGVLARLGVDVPERGDVLAHEAQLLLQSRAQNSLQGPKRFEHGAVRDDLRLVNADQEDRAARAELDLERAVQQLHEVIAEELDEVKRQHEERLLELLQAELKAREESMTQRGLLHSSGCMADIAGNHAAMKEALGKIAVQHHLSIILAPT